MRAAKDRSGFHKILKGKLTGTWHIARNAVEFCGRHPFVTGIVAFLSMVGLALSIVGYNLDRQEASSTTEQVRRVEEKIDRISSSQASQRQPRQPVFRDCDDRQVYLAVMESARNLPEPFSGWTVRGSSEIRAVNPGVCEMTVLFVTGDPSGKIEEVDVSYKTDVPISSIRIQLVGTSEDDCQRIILSSENVVTAISGEVGDGYNCYLLSTEFNRTVTIDVQPKLGDMAASVVGVGDARDKFEFLTTEEEYEIRVFQVFRAAKNERYALLVSVN